MPLAELALENIRCIERAELILVPGVNLIHGANASGKTSLLEGIYLVGRGRSFRTRHTQRLIRHDAPSLQAIGRTAGALSRTLRIAVTRNVPLSAQIAGVPVRSLAELAHAFPVQVIESGIHRLVEEGSPRRRRWLDWTVFHVEPAFIDSWQRYMRVLKQRNTVLRAAGPPEEARAWDSELLRYGNHVAAARERVLAALAPYWQAAVAVLAELPVELRYRSGWKQEATLEEALAASFARDRAHGVTHVGPHRADVELRLEGRLAREVASRGQQKLLGAALVLAQLKLLQARNGLVSTLLLDDPAAELDRHRLGRFVREVRALRCQLVLTSLQADTAPFGPAERVFHVEQGRVKAT